MTAKTLSFSILMLAAAFTVSAQQRVPHIGYVYPAGGRTGTTVEVTVGGQFLDGLSSVRFNDPDMQGEVVEYVKPLTNKEALGLRDRARELVERRSAGASTRPSFTPDDEKELADIRRRLDRFVRRPSSPAIAETATLKVTIPPGASRGRRELRVRGMLGLSNPLPFVVGDLPEVVSAVMGASAEPTAAVPVEESALKIPTTINGQIGPGGVDRYTFRAHKGERLEFRADARSLVPYLADAVPGWFQATLALYDASGREMAYDDDNQFRPDPVLSYKVTEGGIYALEIKDAIYRGREDFVYRITARQSPVAAATGMVCPGREDAEPNNSRETARPVTFPATQSGRIERPGDVDVYAFEVPAGQQLVAEIRARRDGSPLDSIVQLLDDTGHVVASNDDHDDPAEGLETHHADSYLNVRLVEPGRYFLRVADVQHKGGPDYVYTLRLSEPQPDFAVRIVPSAINVRAGSSATLTAHVVRRDGFAGEVELSLADPPAGYRLGSEKIPAGQDQARLTLTVPRAAADEPVPLRLVARASLPGDEVITRPVIPADDQTQAFVYRHLVPADELLVTAVGRPVPKGPPPQSRFRRPGTRAATAP